MLKESRTSQYRKDKRIERKKWAVEYLGGACQNCGHKFHHVCYDFHHIDPTEKETGIAKLLDSSLKTLKRELDKCRLLCGHCHRMLHYREGY